MRQRIAMFMMFSLLAVLPGQQAWAMRWMQDPCYSPDALTWAMIEGVSYEDFMSRCYPDPFGWGNLPPAPPTDMPTYDQPAGGGSGSGCAPKVFDDEYNIDNICTNFFGKRDCPNGFEQRPITCWVDELVGWGGPSCPDVTCENTCQCAPANVRTGHNGSNWSGLPPERGRSRWDQQDLSREPNDPNLDPYLNQVLQSGQVCYRDRCTATCYVRTDYSVYQINIDIGYGQTPDSACRDYGYCANMGGLGGCDWPYYSN